MGTAYLLKPDIMKRLMKFFGKGKRIYFSGILRFVLTIVFFASARGSRYPWIIFFFSMVFLLSGLLIFTIGHERISRIFDWYQGQSNIVFEFIALVVMFSGIIIIYSA